MSFLAAGADVGATIHGTATPLGDVAGKSEIAGVVELLLTAGANVRDADLHWAEGGADPAMVELLLATGQDVSIRDGLGRTPPFDAAESSPRALAILLAAGADLTVRDNDGNTLLHAAAKGEEVGVVALLLEVGIDLNVKNDDGETPLHLAATWSGWGHADHGRGPGPFGDRCGCGDAEPSRPDAAAQRGIRELEPGGHRTLAGVRGRRERARQQLPDTSASGGGAWRVSRAGSRRSAAFGRSRGGRCERRW